MQIFPRRILRGQIRSCRTTPDSVPDRSLQPSDTKRIARIVIQVEWEILGKVFRGLNHAAVRGMDEFVEADEIHSSGTVEARVEVVLGC